MESVTIPASMLLEDFNDFSTRQCGNIANVKLIRWKHPSRIGSIVVNCDGSFRNYNGSGGYGVILRDEDGSFIFAMARYFHITELLKEQPADVKYGVVVLMIEMLAILEGLRLASQLEFRHIEIQSDSKIAISILEGNNLCPIECLGIYSAILREVHMFTTLDFCFVYRESNRAADFLSKFLESNGEKYLTVSELPEELQIIIIEDGIGVPNIRI